MLPKAEAGTPLPENKELMFPFLFPYLRGKGLAKDFGGGLRL